MKNQIKSILSVLISVILSLVAINAAANFTVTPTSVADSVELDKTGSQTFIISNTGDEVLNLTISNSNLISSSDSIVLNLDKTSILNLNVSENSSFTASYTASLGKDTGVYSGSITIDSNKNITQSISYSTNVSIVNGSEIELINEDDNTIYVIAELNKDEDVSFRLKNTGTVDLTDVRIDFSNLEGRDTSDEIEDNDIDIEDDKFDLDIGDSERVQFTIDTPKNIDVDIYEGVIKVTTDQGVETEFDIEVTIDGGDMKIEILQNQLSIDDGVMKMIGEPGDLVDDYEFIVENTGNLNAEDLTFEIQDDLSEIYSNEKISASKVSFSPSKIDLDYGDSEDIEVKIDLDDSVNSGTYSGKIRVLSSNGKVYDDFRIELKVIGDVYIEEVDYSKEIEQDSNYEVKVNVKNQGSTIERGIKVTGTLLGLGFDDEDIEDVSNSFLLSSDSDKQTTLRFEIPEGANDGSHILEIKVDYSDGSIVELYDVEVTRPDHLLKFESSGIGQNTVKCDDSLFVFSKVKNIGTYDETADFEITISGTDISKSLNDVNVDVDDSTQKNFELDITDLKAGEYTVTSKVSYSGFFLKENYDFSVLDCKSGAGIIINNNYTGVVGKVDELGNKITADSKDGSITLFGKEIENKNAYLIFGIAGVVILILLSLFFI